jgi:dTDP-glucose pyrophosphorylase
MDKICTGNFDKIFKIPDIAKENNIKELELTDYLLIYLRHKLLDKITRDENNEIDYLTVEKINDIIEAIMDLQTNTKINLNMPLQIENLLLRIQEE